MKLMDRALSAVGLKRLKRSVFKGAEIGRLFFDWITSILSSNEEIKGDLIKLRSRARDLAKNHPLIRQYLSLLVQNVVGPKGFKFQSQVRNNSGDLNKGINDKIEAGWREFSKAVTTCGRLSLTSAIQLALETVATDGEILIRLVGGYRGNRFNFALQFIDSDRLDHTYNREAEVTPSGRRNAIIMGVEVDEWDAPVAYHILKGHPSEGFNRERVRIPAAEIIHVYIPRRFNQVRGYSWLAPVMSSVKILDGYVEAELVAARTGAAKMGFFYYKDPSNFDLDAHDPNKPLSMDASPGQFQMLPPGLEFQDWSPDHPATAFPPFVKAISRWVASGLTCSYNALANDLEGVNYSSMRSGLLIERDQWRLIQRWLIDLVMDRIFSEWLKWSLTSGALVLDSRDPAKFNAPKFTPRGWAWVDPQKDIQAGLAAVAGRLTTRTAICAENGEDFEEILEGLAEEDKLAAQYGVTLPDLATTAATVAGMSQGQEEKDGKEDSGDGSGKEGEAEDGQTARQVEALATRVSTLAETLLASAMKPAPAPEVRVEPTTVSVTLPPA